VRSEWRRWRMGRKFGIDQTRRRTRSWWWRE
jgi:hypothetical protein